MARIIAGQLRNHTFKAYYSGRYALMPEKLRMAIFNNLGDLSSCQLFLDAYAGSGSLSFEALSRGAQRGLAIEINLRMYNILAENARLLKLQPKLDIRRANNLTILSNLALKFDLIFCDPPLDQAKEEKIKRLLTYLRPGGRLISSLPAALDFDFKAMNLIELYSRNYTHINLGCYELKS